MAMQSRALLLANALGLAISGAALAAAPQPGADRCPTSGSTATISPGSFDCPSSTLSDRIRATQQNVAIGGKHAKLSAGTPICATGARPLAATSMPGIGNVDKDVNYGVVDQQAGRDAKPGAGLTALAPEITVRPDYRWIFL